MAETFPRLSRAPIQEAVLDIGVELPPDIGRELAQRWAEPCELAFEHLLHHRPVVLLAWIRSGNLHVADLTFAAEIAGRHTDAVSVRETLLPLLTHAEPVVREGAVYGLALHLDGEVRSALQRTADEDASLGVRQAARDALARG